MDDVEKPLFPGNGPRSESAPGGELNEGATARGEADRPDKVYTDIAPNTASKTGSSKAPPAEAEIPSNSHEPETGDTAFEELRVIYEETLRDLVQGTGTPDAGKESAAEALLARYVELHGALSASASAQLYRVAIIGLEALSKYRLTIADRIATELEFKTSTSAALGQVMRGLVRFVACFTGLIILVLFPLFVYSFLATNADEIERQKALLTMFSSYKPIIFAFFFGCAGSIVSLLLRLPEFEALTGRSREFIYLTGLTLPLVGGIFAAVTASLFASNIVNFNIREVITTGPLNLHLFIVIGFLSGFSERFTRGLLSTAENSISAGARSEQPRAQRAPALRGPARRSRLANKPGC
jgi:hypothetical protein